MKRLEKYAQVSDLMNISIRYGNEKFHFNLFEETKIDENKINYEIKIQPSIYGFLGMLHKKLFRIAKDKKVEMEKIYAKLYVRFKKQIDPETQRLYPKETAQYRATKNSEYQNKIKEYHDAEEKANIIEICTKSFEQRSNLIQTLSANIRKEN